MKKRQPPNRSLSRRPTTPAPVASADRLLGDIRSLIETARQQVARTVNSGMVALYWHIGKRIREDVLHEQRAGYGEQILQTLSVKLEVECGKGFSRSSLSRMLKLAEYFPDERIVASLMQQLSREPKLLDAIHLVRERLARQTQESMPAPRLPALEKPPSAKTRKGKRSGN